jgi:hypothetical protein
MNKSSVSLAEEGAVANVRYKYNPLLETILAIIGVGLNKVFECD